MGSVLTMGVIELILRVVSFILILAVSRKWDHASCWILIFTSLMDTGKAATLHATFQITLQHLTVRSSHPSLLHSNDVQCM